MRLVLLDGTQVRIRPIRSADKLLLVDGLERLSDESVHRRFLSSKPRLSPRELRYLTEVDMVDHVAYVVVREDRPDLVCGVGRWVRDRDDPHEAEVAIVIGDPLHGQRLGTALGRYLAQAAAERGVHRFTATMLAENVAAHRLLHRIQSELDAAVAGALAPAPLAA